MMKMRKKSSGFTLIEIMIAVAIVGILAGLAYSSYLSSVQKARRTDAKDALLQAAAKQERFYLRSNRYSNDINVIGDQTSAEGYYTIAVVNTATIAGDCTAVGTCYTVSATANSPGAQADNTECTVFRLDNLGRRQSSDAVEDGNDTTDECW
jgi:type IV pilus assembly protein PilE